MAPRLRRIHPALAAALATAFGLASAPTPAAHASNDSPGAKGAQVYCFMRANGNPHEVSWIAAYALIKRQSASMFKTSPEHAAVMITEAVVQSPGSYPDCGRYLGDLYTRHIPNPSGAAASDATSPSGGSSTSPTGGTSRSDRFGN
jgi:hypothetical protein